MGLAPTTPVDSVERMTDETQQAATEAAQAVVDQVRVTEPSAAAMVGWVSGQTSSTRVHWALAVA